MKSKNYGTMKNLVSLLYKLYTFAVTMFALLKSCNTLIMSLLSQHENMNRWTFCQSTVRKIEKFEMVCAM